MLGGISFVEQSMSSRAAERREADPGPITKDPSYDPRPVVMGPGSRSRSRRVPAARLAGMTSRALLHLADASPTVSAPPHTVAAVVRPAAVASATKMMTASVLRAMAAMTTAMTATMTAAVSDAVSAAVSAALGENE